MFKPFGLILISLLLSSCSLLESAIVQFRSTDHFLTLKEDPRVRYEPNAFNMAKLIALALPTAVKSIENQLNKPFKKSITIFVCDSIDSFAKFTTNRTAGGVVVNERLFISPKPQNTAERIPGVLTHELSHLYFRQYADSALTMLPSWFGEGIAVYISNGTGAERVSINEATQAILAGRHFIANDNDSILFRDTASDYSLTPHMFYRQSAMFVEFLYKDNNKAFRKLILNILNKENFGQAFFNAYASSLDGKWREFLATLMS